MGTRESKQELDFVRRVPSVRVLRMIGDAMRERKRHKRGGEITSMEKGMKRSFHRRFLRFQGETRSLRARRRKNYSRVSK